MEISRQPDRLVVTAPAPPRRAAQIACGMFTAASVLVAIRLVNTPGDTVSAGLWLQLGLSILAALIFGVGLIAGQRPAAVEIDRNHGLMTLRRPRGLIGAEEGNIALADIADVAVETLHPRWWQGGDTTQVLRARLYSGDALDLLQERDSLTSHDLGAAADALRAALAQR